jgi:hypothetical protein
MKKIVYLILFLGLFLLFFGCLNGNNSGQANRELMQQQTIQQPPTQSSLGGDIAKSEDISSSTCKKSVPILRVDINGVVVDVNQTLPYELQANLPQSMILSSTITVSGVSSVDLGQGYFMVVDLKTLSDNPWIEEGKSKTIGNAKITPLSFYTVPCN